MKVYALVGKSGTGKSYKATFVAKNNNIHYIIDDGLLIKGNKVLTGKSAKSERTAISATKRALFLDLAHRNDMIKTIEEEQPESLLVLGTSYKMIDRITKALNIEKVDRFFDIEEISSEEEIKAARKCRYNEGKHVIPVPTFEIKKDFSGYFIDKLKIFKKRGKNQYIEKSVVRPTFSYLGKYTISQNVIKKLVRLACSKTKGIYKCTSANISTSLNSLIINFDVEIYYGYNICEVIENLQRQIVEEIEHMTSLHIIAINIGIKRLKYK